MRKGVRAIFLKFIVGNVLMFSTGEQVLLISAGFLLLLIYRGPE